MVEANVLVTGAAVVAGVVSIDDIAYHTLSHSKLLCVYADSHLFDHAAVLMSANARVGSDRSAYFL